MGTYFEINGNEIQKNELTLQRSLELIEVLDNINILYANFVKCMTISNSNYDIVEVIIIDIKPELPQRTVNDILQIERIGVCFVSDDSKYPEVYALRNDFPLVPHLNLSSCDYKSLCIYDQAWSEVKYTWTAINFIELIRNWLTKTARGELHHDSQALEPLFFSSEYTLIIPNNLDEIDTGKHKQLHLYKCNEDGSIMAAFEQKEEGYNQESNILLYQVTTPPVIHGTINKAPNNLKELSALVGQGTFSIVETVSRIIKDNYENNYENKLWILLSVPTKRNKDSDIELYAKYAFCICKPNSIKSIGVELGTWETDNDQIGLLINPELSDGETINIFQLNVNSFLTPTNAAKYNARKFHNNRKVCVLGVGAIGSQVVMNLARAGFAQWVVIDGDSILPHNLARHSLQGWALGQKKSNAISHQINSLFMAYESTSRSIEDFAFSSSVNSDEIEKELNECDLILDMAVSISISRELAFHNSHARRISIFLNPKGTDLVVLAESKNREQRLDLLEMTYYREIIQNKNLKDHLFTDTKSVRYGNSCRDISSRISQDNVATLSGIASGYIHNILKSDVPSINVWRINPNNYSVINYEVPCKEYIESKVNDWTLSIHKSVLDDINSTRSSRLPNETGGVLIGSFDLIHKMIYLVDIISLIDGSIEMPNSYIRGNKGLLKEVNHISDITLEALSYVGEWHSHPDKSETSASNDDKGLFKWITKNMELEGKPPVMIISGKNKLRCYIGRIGDYVDINVMTGK